MRCPSRKRFAPNGRSLFTQLYAHQKEGIAWMYELYKEAQGGVLADDMGLGKTVQIATYLKGLFDAGQAKKALVVVPATLKGYWHQELSKWCPRVLVKQFDESKKRQEREKCVQKIKRKGGARPVISPLRHPDHELRARHD